MHVTHVIPYLGKAQGGPVHALALLATAQVEAGLKVSLVAAPRPQDGPVISHDSRIDTAWVSPPYAGMFRWSPRWVERILATKPDVIHSHGLWTYAGRASGRAAHGAGIPHVLAPCGMLQAGALLRSKLRKQICWRTFQKGVVQRAHCLHAKSQAEVASIREAGMVNPVAIVPNPIDHPRTVSPQELSGIRTEVGVGDDERLLLYLGRLHPVKGLERLLYTWQELGEDHGNWRLLLAGPDEGGYKQILEALIVARGIKSVSFFGDVQLARKWALLNTADLFVMPSEYENFGSAIAEAMLAGVPVVTTTGTPWKQLHDRNAGYWVAPTVDALREALDAAMRKSQEERQTMGQNAQRLATAFTPQKVARQTMELYEWLLGSAKQPTVVNLVTDPKY